MRYTESKLSPIAEVLLSELGQGTVDWAANFDGTLEEPTWLPARLPHLLLNGTTGIAVGMATDVPPHNLNESRQRLRAPAGRSRRQRARPVRARARPGLPDHGGNHHPAADLQAIYETGNGSVRARGVFVKERQHRHHRAALPGQPEQDHRADRAADARQEAALAGRHPRRIRPRQPDPHRAGPAQQPRRRRTADGTPVRHHRPGEAATASTST
jgi:hypothetical protein